MTPTKTTSFGAAAILIGAGALSPAAAGPFQAGPMIRTPVIAPIARPAMPVQSAPAPIRAPVIVAPQIARPAMPVQAATVPSPAVRAPVVVAPPSVRPVIPTQTATTASPARMAAPQVPASVNVKPAGFGQGGGALGALGNAQGSRFGGILPGGTGQAPGSGQTPGLNRIGAGDILKSVNGSGAAGRAQAAVKNIPGSQGNAQGRQSGDGVTGRNLGVIKTGAEAAKSSAGRLQGIQRENGVDGRNAGKITTGVATAREMQGAATGRQRSEGGPQLSKQQQAELKNSLKGGVVNPKINQSDEGKGNGKGNTGSGNNKTIKEIEKLFKPFADAANKKVGYDWSKPIPGLEGKPKPNPK